MDANRLKSLDLFQKVIMVAHCPYLLLLVCKCQLTCATPANAHPYGTKDHEHRTTLINLQVYFLCLY